MNVESTLFYYFFFIFIKIISKIIKIIPAKISRTEFSIKNPFNAGFSVSNSVDNDSVASSALFVRYFS